MKQYCIIYKNPFVNGFKLTKLEFLVFNEMLDVTSAADSESQEGGHLLIFSKEFEERIKNNTNISENVARSAMTKLIKRGVYRKVQGVAHVYQLNPWMYGKINDESEKDIIALRNRDLFVKE